jgi:hypothetical protein
MVVKKNELVWHEQLIPVCRRHSIPFHEISAGRAIPNYRDARLEKQWEGGRESLPLHASPRKISGQHSPLIQSSFSSKHKAQ